jgi:hypothetical protein
MGSLICRLFGHRYAGQHYEMENQRSCRLTATCSRCGQKQSQAICDHQYQEWRFVVPNSCEQVRECSQCGYKEKQIAHVSNGWVIRKGNPCEQIQQCARCAAQLGKSIQHDFGAWSIGSDCRPTRKCQKCGYCEISPVAEHTDLEWVKSPSHPCIRFEVCKQCGFHTGKSKQDHQFGPPGIENKKSEYNGYFDAWMSSWDEVRVCRICGQKVVVDVLADSMDRPVMRGSDWV